MHRASAVAVAVADWYRVAITVTLAITDRLQVTNTNPAADRFPVTSAKPRTDRNRRRRRAVSFGTSADRCRGCVALR